MPRVHRPVLLAALPALSVMACGGQATAGPGAPCPPVVDEPVALLTLDCRGGVVAGQADWDTEPGAVVLELRGTAPDASRVVDAWPPASRPPWLGQPPARTLVFPPRGIRVEFPGRAAVPLELFTDPRLGRAFGGGPQGPEGDARDRIDQGLTVRTRDERAVDYGRALGRDVVRERFDRTWFVVFRDGVDRARARRLGTVVARAWERSGVEGARRAWARGPGLPEAEGCRPLDASVVRAAGRRGRSDGTSRPRTVSYPVDDPVAREIGERLVSATLPGGAAEWLAPSGLAVRAYAPGEPPVTGGDLATVVGVITGPAHPCSVWGELKWVEAWFGGGTGDGGAAGSVRVLPIGETAVFRVGPGGAGP